MEAIDPVTPITDWALLIIVELAGPTICCKNTALATGVVVNKVAVLGQKFLSHGY